VKEIFQCLSRLNLFDCEQESLYYLALEQKILALQTIVLRQRILPGEQLIVMAQQTILLLEQMIFLHQAKPPGQRI
jgi:hypothetical protein